jgi:hypothetical protein
MIATIRNKIESVHATTEANKTLRSIMAYTWISCAALFVAYLYFVGSITFSIITQQGLEQRLKSLVSSMSRQELKYLTSEQQLTAAYGESLGLVKAPTIAFAAPVRAFAWNVGR